MLKPLNGRIIAEVISDAKRLDSGLYIADKVKEYPHRAKVISVGGHFRSKKGKIWKSPAKKGDIIHFKRWKQDSLKSRFDIWGRDLIVLDFDAIVGVEETDAKGN